MEVKVENEDLSSWYLPHPSVDFESNFYKIDGALIHALVVSDPRTVVKAIGVETQKREEKAIFALWLQMVVGEVLFRNPYP